jgi:hypothetical protein
VLTQKVLIKLFRPSKKYPSRDTVPLTPPRFSRPIATEQHGGTFSVKLCNVIQTYQKFNSLVVSI